MTWQRALLAGLVPLVLLVRGMLVPSAVSGPAQVPPQQAELWMVDALPDVGPKRQVAALEAVHAQRVADLPARARPVATQVFAGLGADLPPADVTSRGGQ